MSLRETRKLVKPFWHFFGMQALGDSQGTAYEEYDRAAMYADHAASPRGDYSELPKFTGQVLRRLDRQMLARHGQGRGEDYRPWIHIRRSLKARRSRHCLTHLPLRARSFHLLSKLESNIALAVGWLGAGEIREGLPAWPIEHASPARGWDASLDAKLGTVPGLLEIARNAGIDHGEYPGTQVPFVATIDIVAVLPPLPPHKLLFVGCKPSSELLNNPRALERLELERLYAQACGGVHAIAHEKTFDEKLIENLQWIVPRHSDLQRLQSTSILDDFSGEFLRCAAELPIAEARNVAAARVGGKEDPETLLRASLWTRRIDADLTREIIRSRPLVRCGERIVRSCLAKLLK